MRSGAKGKGSKPGKKASVPVRTPAVIDKSDVNRWLLERQEVLYRTKHKKCLLDFASKEAAKSWHNYVTLPNGDQGPRPFRDQAEMDEFKRRFHFGVE